MPRIKRWFPVSHDINADEEMWELRDTFGDRAGFVWLEILSIADRNEGRVGRDSDQLRAHLASKLRTNRAKVSSILGWLSDHTWIKRGQYIEVVNYTKYHMTREQFKSHAGTNDGPSEPSEPSETSELKEGSSSEPVDKSKNKSREALAAACMKVCAADSRRFAGGPTELIRWQHHGVMVLERTETKDVAVKVILETLGQLEKALKEGKVAGDWRDYAEAIRKRVRTETLMREAEDHKQYDPQSTGAILQKMMKP